MYIHRIGDTDRQRKMKFIVYAVFNKRVLGIILLNLPGELEIGVKLK